MESIKANEASETFPKKPLGKFEKAIEILREILAIISWSMVIAQVLVFDLASYVSIVFPKIAILVQFRLLFIIGFLSLSWLILGNRKFRYFLGYILVYPVIVLFWKLPKLFFRNWTILFACAPAIYSFFTSIKRTVALFSFALIFFFAVIFSNNLYLIPVGMAYLIMYLIRHFFNRFRAAFSPTTVFSIFGKKVKQICGRLEEADFWVRPDDSKMNPNDCEKKVNENLTSIYFFAAILHYLAERLRVVIYSKKLDAYLILALLHTVSVTVLVFSIEYFGLEKISPRSFSGVIEPGYFEFLGLSFGRLFTSDISQLKPVSALSQVFMYSELSGTFFIITLLLFVIFTSNRERNRQDMDDIVKSLGSTLDNIEELLLEKYSTNFAKVEVVIVKNEPKSARWLLTLRHGADKATEITKNSPPSQ